MQVTPPRTAERLPRWDHPSGSSKWPDPGDGASEQVRTGLRWGCWVWIAHRCCDVRWGCTGDRGRTAGAPPERRPPSMAPSDAGSGTGLGPGEETGQRSGRAGSARARTEGYVVTATSVNSAEPDRCRVSPRAAARASRPRLATLGPPDPLVVTTTIATCACTRKCRIQRIDHRHCDDGAFIEHLGLTAEIRLAHGVAIEAPGA